MKERRTYKDYKEDIPELKPKIEKLLSEIE